MLGMCFVLSERHIILQMFQTTLWKTSAPKRDEGREECNTLRKEGHHGF